MYKFSKVYLYGGGVILVTTVITFLYLVLFNNLFEIGQWVAAVALAGTGATFMSVGHAMSVKSAALKKERRDWDEKH